MALTCPKCKTPHAVVVVTGPEGMAPFPCFECGFSKFKLREGTIVSAQMDDIAPCEAPGCDGSRTTTVAKDDHGNVIRIHHHRCTKCAT